MSTYERYDAPDLGSARAHLAARPATGPLSYVEIHTPEGGIGKDYEGVCEFAAE